LGLSIGTLRNYDAQGKLVAERDERGQWWYPLATLDEFASLNVLLCSRGERASALPRQPAVAEPASSSESM
jgi:hypothetical protein